MKSNKYLISLFSMPIVLGLGSTSFISCNSNSNVSDKFQSDTWANVVLNANQGLDHLKQYYGVSSFVGLTRTVNLLGLQQTVRVIGENEDYIADAEGKPTQNTAALTFQFTNVLSYTLDDVIYPITVSMGSSSWGWINSGVRTWLTNNDSPNTFFHLMEIELGEGAVQKVSKRSVEHSWDSSDISEVAETFFIPSLADIYNEEQIEYVEFEYGENYINEVNTDSEGETGGPYSWYKQNIDQNDQEAFTHPIKALALNDCSGSNQPYWLRTSFINMIEDVNAHFCIWTRGQKAPMNEGEIMDQLELPIAPAFCIGKTINE